MPEPETQHTEADTIADVVIVVPAYQEAATIGGIVARCRQSWPAAAVVVVDDGSTDGSGAIAASAGAVVLQQPRNGGKGRSLTRGFLHALELRARCVVSLDADGQHRPEDLPRLLACAAACPDRIIIGSRRAGSAAAPRGRRISNLVADFWISWAAGWPVEDSQSGFRVYPAALLQQIRLPHAAGFAWESELLIAAGRVGVRTMAVAIPSIYGSELRRASHFRPVQDITRIVLMVGGHLLRRGMHPVGLWRTLKGDKQPDRAATKS